MNKDKSIGIIIWALGLILSLVSLFCLANGLTATLWITLGFVCVAYISVLVFLLFNWNKQNSMDEGFMKLPSVTISFIYIIVQIPICIVFAIGSGAISSKVAILVNAVVFVIAWMLVLASIAGNGRIQKVNNRQKNHHTEL